MTAAIAAGRRLFPRGYADFGYQLLIWFGFLAAYQVARGVADAIPTGLRERVARDRRRAALAGLGELTLQGWTQSSHLLETLVSWTYWNSEFTVVGLALLWIYFRRHDAFTASGTRSCSQTCSACSATSSCRRRRRACSRRWASPTR